MKIKVQPNDFIVKEICNFELADHGPYQIYELEKIGWDTFDLLDYLSRVYHIKEIGRAGIKDRYSHSFQFISIRTNRVYNINEKNFKLRFLGYSKSPITINNLIKNWFSITIRDLKENEIKKILSNIECVKKYGIPNYYDEQRMGSARAQGGFIAVLLAKKHYNGALKLYLATPSKFDSSITRKLKKHINTYWGKWDKCLSLSYDYGQLRYPLLYLKKHPKDFKGAIKTIRKDLLEMFINAYQAYVFNETLKAVLKSLPISLFTVRYRFGELYFYENLSPDTVNYLSNLIIPSASYKSTFKELTLKSIVEEILQKDSLSLEKLKIDLGIKGVFFKPYERKALIVPENLLVSEINSDELYKDRFKVTLSFCLPKGSYATILIKRLGHL
ncbi:MAG: tRNA pseudouridine(13) synthase TruD [candidate division WOR-3 bacterium]|nr:tRNA pseudouridine(13) synthase TruD [candidate division WOR-3 bacterium]